MSNDVREIQAGVSKLMQANAPDPTSDIQRERAKASFDVDQLAAHLNGGRNKLLHRRNLAKILSATPWADKSKRYFLTREEEYVGGLRAAVGIWMKMADEGMSVEDALMVRSMVDWPGGLELHIGMFIPTIVGQGTAEQKAELLPKCNTLQIIGTYAQTELGHGTFVRGLETTATYVPASESFIIHSPTLTSTKWWPGGLAKTATHAVVMARLFIHGRDHGPHAFIVQIRDLETHKRLPGIEVGDIGPKFGYNGVDNGYLRFDHVVIPRSAMLMKYSKVLKDGTYVPPPPDNLKASYSTMVFVRADIVRLASKYLAKASTIAVRYCSVRRQTAKQAGQQETQVIDYENTAATLFPILAAAYVQHYMGQALWDAYLQYEADRKAGKFDILPRLHALSSGLKAVTTNTTANGIEACRRTCGGHGYSILSGLPTLYASYVQNCTWEGDNNVLLLQTARYINKFSAALLKGGGAEALPADCKYLALMQQLPSHKCKVHVLQDWAVADAQVDALSHRAARLAVKALVDLQEGSVSQSADDALNSCTTSLIKLAQAHCELVMLENYHASLAKLQSSGDVSTLGCAVLQTVGNVWLFDLMQRNLGDFLEDGYMSSDQAALVHRMLRDLLQELRPSAVALVDAWAFTDYELNSALGREDGDVYRALLDMAKSSPFNRTDEGPAWEPVLKPAMQKLRGKM